MSRTFKRFIYPISILFSLTLAACGGGGGSGGTDTTPVPGDPTNANLSGLAISAGSLDQIFQNSQHSYTATTGFTSDTITVTPTTADSGATVTVNNTPVNSGSASSSLPLNIGDNPISIIVTSQDALNNTTYTINIKRSNASAFAESAILTASTPDTGDRLGQQVSISGDTLVVGAPGAGGTGSAFVFTKSGGNWTEQAVLVASNAEADDLFGKNVDISGDSIIIGAPLEDSNGTGEDNNENSSAGAAYIFTRTGTTWSQQAYLKPSTPAANDLFGTAVGIENGTAVVSANLEDTTADDSGAAYVFLRNGTTWSQEAIIKASDAAKSDNFGTSLSLSGEKLAVGANGAAYVFSRSGTTWTQDGPAITAGDGDPDDFFGFDVALDGDTLAVGSFLEDSNAQGIDGSEADDNAPNSGAVHIFTRGASSWDQQAYIKASDTTDENQFGKRVALLGNSLAISSDQRNNKAGAVYYFTRSGTTWTENSIKTANTPADDDLYGSDVAISAGAIAIGAKGQRSNTGAVYILE